MLTFVVDDASFDQDWLLSVELLVGFPGLDQLCGICPPGPVSIEGTVSWRMSTEAHKSKLGSKMSVSFPKLAT